MSKILLPAAAVAFTWLLMSGCYFDDFHHGGYRNSGPTHWAPAHGYRQKQAYHYYYDHEVYYHVARREYSWLDGGRWHVGVSLPSHLHIDLGSGYVSVDVEGNRPQAFHHTIKAKHPPRHLKRSEPRNRGKGRPY